MNRAYFASLSCPIWSKNRRTPLRNSKFLGQIGREKCQNRPNEHDFRHCLNSNQIFGEEPAEQTAPPKCKDDFAQAHTPQDSGLLRFCNAEPHRPNGRDLQKNPNHTAKKASLFKPLRFCFCRAFVLRALSQKIGFSKWWGVGRRSITLPPIPPRNFSAYTVPSFALTFSDSCSNRRSASLCRR